MITSQPGSRAKDWAEDVARELHRQTGIPASVYHVGDMMYQADRTIPRGRILFLSQDRLRYLRALVFTQIELDMSKNPGRHAIVVSHAAFKWNHDLFMGFDFKELRTFAPTTWIFLNTDIDMVYHRMRGAHPDLRFTLLNLVDWRQEEIVVGETMAAGIGLTDRYFLINYGESERSVLHACRIIRSLSPKGVYTAFPITFVQNNAKLMAEIESFRGFMARRALCFDPNDIEFLTVVAARKAKAAGKKRFKHMVCGEEVVFETADILAAANRIESQLIARDMRLIQQAQAIVALVPAEDKKPVLSTGVTMETLTALTRGKEVFLVWMSKFEPSPFMGVPHVTERVASFSELNGVLSRHGYLN